MITRGFLHAIIGLIISHRCKGSRPGAIVVQAISNLKNVHKNDGVTWGIASNPYCEV